MKTISLHLYQFDELDDKARQKALNESININVNDNWWDFIYEDFTGLCAWFGITVSKKRISFQGFYSQGDGSGFDAGVNLKMLFQSIRTQAWKNYAPQLDWDIPEPPIDRRVIALIEKGAWDDQARIISRSRGYGVVVDLGILPFPDPPKNHDLLFAELEELEKWLLTVANRINKQLYQCLQTEYEYLTSDETIIETLNANEYLFTADGRTAHLLERLAATPKNEQP